jgi:hypothetical protein
MQILGFPKTDIELQGMRGLRAIEHFLENLFRTYIFRLHM